MSEENTERFTIDELRNKKGETDWERVDRQTEEELEEAISGDPDATLTGTDWMKTARFIVPGEKKAGDNEHGPGGRRLFQTQRVWLPDAH